MITLGIELSSRQGSVALLRNGRLLAEQSWIAERVRHNTVFQALDDLMQTTGTAYGDIALYAVGRGPGSFSGMRMSFAIAQALALPGKTEVRAVSSGAALALRTARTSRHAQQQIAVVGDARRGQCWLGLFNVDALSSPCPAEERGNAAGTPRLQLLGDWKLVPYEEVPIPEKTIVVSPEAERLTKIFPGIGPACFPHAKEVAELALLQTASEPLEPLYLHPPVFM